MRLIAIIATAVLPLLAGTAAFAHGDQPHPTCKKGYGLNDAHKCVKAPG